MLKHSRDRIGIFLALSVVGLDQFSKWLVDHQMALHQSIPVFPGLLSLTYVRNTGVAFGLFASASTGLRSILLLFFSLVAIGAILFMWVRNRQGHLLLHLALALILGGALGNLIDRLRMGEVIDFIDVYWRDLHWPAFNVADSAITIGVILLLIHLIFYPERASPNAKLAKS
jgi:signal peptidase II